MAPRGGWSKRHYRAARRRGEETRAKGRRALYIDTVRWWAHRRHGDDFQAALRDPQLAGLWERRSQTDDRDDRMKALEEFEILTLGGDGKWRYSDAFMSWLFEEV